MSDYPTEAAYLAVCAANEKKRQRIEELEKMAVKTVSAFDHMLDEKDRRIEEMETELKRYRECLEAIAAESEMKIPTGNGWTYTYSEMAAKALKPPKGGQ